MSKREVIANGNKHRGKNSTNQIALVWSSIQAHWHEKKAAMVANYNDVGQKRGEDLHFSMQTTQSSQGSSTTNQNETDKTKITTHKKKEQQDRSKLVEKHFTMKI